MWPHGERNGYWWTRGTLFGGAGNQREFGCWKSTVGWWKSDAGRQLRIVVYCWWLMEGGCRLLELAASNTVSVIHTTTSAVRLLLTDQRTTPWKASGAGVAARKEPLVIGTAHCKNNSLATAVSPSLWLVIAAHQKRAHWLLVRPFPTSWFSGRREAQRVRCAAVDSRVPRANAHLQQPTVEFQQLKSPFPLVIYSSRKVWKDLVILTL